jgi:DNA sulfur modification protein DndD
MFLKSITLRDWKAYGQAKFEFPSPKKGKNIILIGAKNGFGKTSLFEAIVLGLFGKDGLPLIARAPFSGVGDAGLSTNYKSFIEKSINKNALSDGRTSCSVTLLFGMDEEDEEIEIRRIWNFTDSGGFKPQDEEIVIYEGARRKVVGPRSVDVDRAEWFRDYIAKNFLPYYLAAFFMFDGEQVSVFAEREMSAQVRQGIEGLLGIPVLRELADDLRKYSSDRRRSTPSGSNQTLIRLESERDALNETLNNARLRLEVLQPQLHNLTSEREALTRELESYGAGSQAVSSPLFMYQ